MTIKLSLVYTNLCFAQHPRFGTRPCLCFSSLADLATLHDHITQQYGLTERNTWISFGGSYPGALSAWFRIKVIFTKIHSFWLKFKTRKEIISEYYFIFSCLFSIHTWCTVLLPPQHLSELR